MASGASLARAVGPTIGGVLLTNSANGMDENTLFRTFSVAAGIMFIACLIAVYSVRARGPVSFEGGEPSG
jgi:hypothetical protein